MFSGIGLGQEIQLRMHQNASQSIPFFQKFSGGACPQNPLLNLPPIFSTCSYPSATGLQNAITRGKKPVLSRWRGTQKPKAHPVCLNWRRLPIFKREFKNLLGWIQPATSQCQECCSIHTTMLMQECGAVLTSLSLPVLYSCRLTLAIHSTFSQSPKADKLYYNTPGRNKLATMAKHMCECLNMAGKRPILRLLSGISLIP